MSPRKYIEKITETYISFFGEKPPKIGVSSPLENNDHPELDTSDLLGDDDIQKYQCLISQLQWAIAIGRFDISLAIMTMSSFRVMPRVGHLDRLKRIVGYLCKFKHYRTRFRIGEPD